MKMLKFSRFFFSMRLVTFNLVIRILGSPLPPVQILTLNIFINVPYWGNDFAIFYGNNEIDISNIIFSFCCSWIIKAFWRDVWQLQIFEQKIFEAESREIIASSVRFAGQKKRKQCFCKTYCTVATSLAHF